MTEQLACNGFPSDTSQRQKKLTSKPEWSLKFTVRVGFCSSLHQISDGQLRFLLGSDKNTQACGEGSSSSRGANHCLMAKILNQRSSGDAKMHHRAFQPPAHSHQRCLGKTFWKERIEMASRQTTLQGELPPSPVIMFMSLFARKTPF